MPGETCNGCGDRLKPLGEDVTEELDYIPGRFFMNRFVRPRLACGCCETIAQAPLGTPTLADRIAQEVVRRRLEPMLDPTVSLTDMTG